MGRLLAGGYILVLKIWELGVSITGWDRRFCLGLAWMEHLYILSSATGMDCEVWDCI